MDMEGVGSVPVWVMMTRAVSMVRRRVVREGW